MKLVSAALALFLPLLSATAAPSSDNSFLAARDAARNADRARLERLADAMHGHELAAYLDYWLLSLGLKDADPSTVRAFLTRNAGSYLADKLRGDWLKELGKAGRWGLFDAEFPALLQPDRELTCYALQSRQQKGDASVLEEAMPLWLALLDPPEACQPVLESLITAKRVGSDEVWALLRRQIENGRLSAARRTMNYLPPSQTPDAKTASAVTNTPLPWLVKTRLTDTRMQRELAALAIARVARNDPRMAAEQLERLDGRLGAEEKAWAWSQVGWQAALRHMDEALAWYRRAGEAPLSDEAAQWKIRAALRAQNWTAVRQAIGQLSPSLAEQPAWIYWLGRALRAEGKRTEAELQFVRIAGLPEFYGNLADEELGREISVPPRATAPTTAELARIEAEPSIRRALALFGYGLRLEGVREWNWGTRDMGDRELLAAAEVANRAGVYDRAIAAAVRTRAEQNYDMRYLAPFSDQVRPAARAQALDDAWVYGLMRQESRFVTDARSSAGASGLMQLMPATARWVAKKIGLNDYHHGRVTQTETNLLLGTSYMRMVMERLDNHPVLASAGYNAGPGRALKWKADRPLEGAIYAETIPFSETRDYVKKVMSNATYYAVLFEQRPQSLKSRLGTIAPRAASNSGSEELP